jgi:pimeloyl-ACP methyl ester carboxylesterase
LAKAGIATLCWDKRGVGESTGGDRAPGDPPGERDAHADDLTDVADAASALAFLTQQPEIDPHRIAIWGWSAGVQFTSLLAAQTDLPAAYVLVAGVYRSLPELVEYLFDWINPYLARVPEAEMWIKSRAPYHYKYAKHWHSYVEAAVRGEDVYEAGEGEDVARFYLARMKQGLAYPPAEQFQHIQKPTLVIHGDRDVNVPVEDCYEIARALNDSGNSDVTLVVVPRADHGMRINPVDASIEERRLARITPNASRHPLSEFFVQSVIGWLVDHLTIPL